MKIEWLIGFYIFICIAMAIFEFIFFFSERIRYRRLKKRSEKCLEELRSLDLSTLEFDLHDFQKVDRSLKHLTGLELLDTALSRYQIEDPLKCQAFLQDMAPLMECLTRIYLEKDTLRCAYFSYILGRWYKKRPASIEVLEYLTKVIWTREFYARQNALMSLSAMGNAEVLARAIVYLEMSNGYHHPKLITEAFLVFTGDSNQLSQELINRFDSFAPDLQAAFINFGRMAHIEYSDEQQLANRRRWLLSLMRDRQRDAEVRLACIRYFTSCVWPDAATQLRAFASSKEPGEWEFSAVAATALVRYPGAETVEVLKKCLSSRVWHVRQNAAKSLCDLGVSLEDLKDIFEGDDEYARDALLFRWEKDKGLDFQTIAATFLDRGIVLKR